MVVWDAAADAAADAAKSVSAEEMPASVGRVDKAFASRWLRCWSLLLEELLEVVDGLVEKLKASSESRLETEKVDE